MKNPQTTRAPICGRASVMEFALELMGAKDLRNYYKGWSEWGNAPDTPVVKGKEANKSERPRLDGK